MRDKTLNLHHFFVPVHSPMKKALLFQNAKGYQNSEIKLLISDGILPNLMAFGRKLT